MKLTNVKKCLAQLKWRGPGCIVSNTTNQNSEIGIQINSVSAQREKGLKKYWETSKLMPEDGRKEKEGAKMQDDN